MRKSIEALMTELGCEKWPSRWSESYDDVMDSYEKNGCPLTDPSYYEEIHNTYGILPNHLDVYKKQQKM